MKKTTTLFLLIVTLVIKVTAQSPITLTQSNFGKLQSYPINTNFSWDTSTFKSSTHSFDGSKDSCSASGNVSYNTPSDAFFVGKTDAYFTIGYAIATGLAYNVDLYFYTSSTMYGQNAIGIADQNFPLVSVTSGATDTLYIKAQKTILPVAREILHFPASFPYHNNIRSRRAVNFELSVASASLNHTPGQHVKNVVRNDTMINYGKLRMYTPTGVSAYYDVLVLKSYQYDQDSFYVGGNPAPPSLTNAFHITQGQITNRTNRIYVFRTGTAVPMMLFTMDSTFSSFSNLDMDGSITAAPANGIKEVGGDSYSTILFPNPTHQREISLMILGKEIDLINYTITDMTGRTVQTAIAQPVHGSTIKISLDESIANGNYVIQVTDTKNQVIATEQIAVAK